MPQETAEIVGVQPASAAAIPKAVTIAGTSGHVRRNTHYVRQRTDWTVVSGY
jgi:hypothetical protein